MSAFWRLLQKELRELARPQYLVPLLVMPLFVVLSLQGVGAAEDAATERPTVVVVDNDGERYAALATETLRDRANVTRHESSVTQQRAVNLLQSGPARTLFVFPENFTERIGADEQANVRVYSSISYLSTTTGARSAKVRALLAAVDANITANVTGASPAALDPTTNTHTTYVKGTHVPTSPSELSSSVSLRFFFLGMVMVLAIFGAGSLVINSMGSEKENGTLETLLTMPVQRRTIVGAKLGASAVLGVALAAVYIGVLYVARPDSGGGSIIQLTAGDYALIGVSLSLAIIDVLAVALALGVFADDSRGAQTLLLPVTFVTMVPAFVTGFVDVSALSLPLKAAFYAIPSTHPVIAPTELAFGDTSVVLLGMAYEVGFGAVVIALTVRLFGSDRLVTGDAGRLGVVLDALQD